MFDTHKSETHKIHVRHPEKILHEYKRAPTDDSIRILKEYEEKIHSQISEKLLIKDNNIEFSLAFTTDNIMNNRGYVKFTVNGIEHTENFIINTPNPDDIFMKIKNWIIDILSLDITRSLFNERKTLDFMYKKHGY